MGKMVHLGEHLLQGKVIVISGGTKGIGKGVADECAYQGAKVIISGRDQSAGDMICRSINEKYASRGGSCTFVYADISRTEDCQKMFDTAMAMYGKVDGFVNYAGITPVASLTECEEPLVDSVFDINIKAALFCTKYAVLCMQRGNGGSIVACGSVHAAVGEKNRVAYACTKGALRTLSEHISRHYAKDHIRCNHLTIGWVATEGEIALRKSMGVSLEELQKQASDFIPMGRIQTVEDHVPAIIYLLSDASSMVTGSDIRVTGGLFI